MDGIRSKPSNYRCIIMHRELSLGKFLVRLKELVIYTAIVIFLKKKFIFRKSNLIMRSKITKEIN